MNNSIIAHYRIVKKLGCGGMAEVYQAKDIKSNEPVALKILLPHLVEDEVVRQRFLREAKVGMDLNHPGIARVYEVGEDNNRFFIAMELVKGKSLQQLIEHTPLSLRQAIAIAQQVADALAVAHRQGIVHRDIKPGNIMVTGDKVKLMDFGLARVVDTTSLTDKHEVIGTLYYMSPEQVIGEKVDYRTDIFSLGVVLYQMLTARLPFGGEHVGMVVHAILYSDPLRIRELDRSLPKEVDQIVCKALQKNVDRRFQSAIDLKTDLFSLKDILEGKPVALIASDICAEEVFEKHRGIYSALIGREQEMEQLQRKLTQVLQGRSVAVFLSGEAGIGKSRLIWELGQKARMQDVLYLVGRCPSRGGAPYQPILELLRQYFDIKGINDNETLNNFIVEHANHLRHRKDIVAALVLQYAAENMNIVDKEQLWDTTAEIIKVMAQDRPIIIHIDDLHWADASTLDMLVYVIRNTAEARVFIIGTYRPEDITEAKHPLRRTLKNIGKENLVHEFSLKRLDRKRTQNVISSVFENSSFTDMFIDSIYRETEGNPLFVLEVLKLLKDENIIVRHNGGWRTVSETTDLQIPKSVTHVILRRLKRLSKEERELLDIAAVEGSSFQSDTISHCLEQPRVKILRRLQDLESSHNLIHATKHGFQFDHGKIKDVIYSSIIPELRKEYHKIIGQYLAEKFGNRQQYAGMLAHHLYNGGLENDSLCFLLKAGEYARKVFANNDAIRYYEMGIKVVDEQLRINPAAQMQKTKLSMLKGYALANSIIGRYKEAIDALNSMISMAESTNNKQEQMIGITELGNVLCKRAEYGLASKHYYRAIRICHELHDRQYEPEILIGLALATHYNKDNEQSMKLLHSVIDVSKGIADRTHEARAYGFLAVLYTLQANYEQAFNFFRKALKILKSRSSQYERAYFLNQLGVANRHCGRYNEALRYLKQSLSIQEKIGDKENQILSLNNIGLTYTDMGNIQAADICLKKGYDIATCIGDVRNLSFILGNLGWNAYKKGDTEKALEYCKQALGIARRIKDVWHEGIMLSCMGWIHASIGRYRLALEYCRGSLKLARKIKNGRSESSALDNLAVIYMEQGNLQKAMICEKRASEIAEKIGIEKAQWFCLTNLYRMYFNVGEIRKSFYLFRKAIAIMQTCKSKRILGWLFYYRGLNKKHRGLIRESYADIKKCLMIARQIRDDDMRINAQLLAGEVELTRRNYATAMRHAQRALKISTKLNRKIEIANAYLLAAHILLAEGNFDGTISNTMSALTIAKEYGIKELLWQTCHVLGKAYIMQKQYAKAHRALKKAEKIITKIALRLYGRPRRAFLRKKQIMDLFKDLDTVKNAL